MLIYILLLLIIIILMILESIIIIIFLKKRLDQYAFAVADLCISRAGSNTVFEIIALKIPNILIPLPKGVSRGDQILNANYFEKLNLSSVLAQEQLTVDSLCNLIKETYNNKTKFLSALKKSKIKNQSKHIAQKIIEVAKQR